MKKLIILTLVFLLTFTTAVEAATVQERFNTLLSQSLLGGTTSGTEQVAVKLGLTRTSSRKGEKTTSRTGSYGLNANVAVDQAQKLFKLTGTVSFTEVAKNPITIQFPVSIMMQSVSTTQQYLYFYVDPVYVTLLQQYGESSEDIDPYVGQWLKIDTSEDEVKYITQGVNSEAQYAGFSQVLKSGKLFNVTSKKVGKNTVYNLKINEAFFRQQGKKFGISTKEMTEILAIIRNVSATATEQNGKLASYSVKVNFTNTDTLGGYDYDYKTGKKIKVAPWIYKTTYNFTLQGTVLPTQTLSLPTNVKNFSFEQIESEARAKGQVAAGQAYLSNMRAQAELYYSNKGDYGLPTSSCTAGIFADTEAGGLKNLVSDLNNYTTASSCNATPQAWSVSARLQDGTFWCVDSTGNSKKVTGLNGAGVTACAAR